MAWISNHGTGVMIHGVERRGDGRVGFTSSVCVFWVPLLPLRSWSGVYLGEGPPDGISDEAHRFADLRRVPHDWGRLFQTFALGLLAAACAVAPAYGMVSRVSGRAATGAEMAFVFASACWPVAVVIWAERRRRRRLQGR